MTNNLPSYAELIATLENAQSVRSIGLTEKRIEVLVKALRIADAGVVGAMQDLLNYTGGWDLPLHGDHPISKARRAIARAGMGPLPRSTDLSKYTESERRRLALIVEIGDEGLFINGNHFGLDDRVLLHTGLITVEELTGSDAGTWVLRATAKGQAAQ